jgi:hypothetical protein
VSDDGTEDCLQVQRRANRLANLPEGLQLLHRPGQLVRPRLHLLEQADVLDGDHRLVRERRHQLDLLVGEGPDLLLPDNNHSNEGPLPEHGDPQYRSQTPQRCPGICVLRVGQDVMDMNGSALQRHPPRGALSPGPHGVLLGELPQLRWRAIGYGHAE